MNEHSVSRNVSEKSKHYNFDFIETMEYRILIYVYIKSSQQIQ
jgi:hypothetical protein